MIHHLSHEQQKQSVDSGTSEPGEPTSSASSVNSTNCNAQIMASSNDNTANDQIDGSNASRLTGLKDEDFLEESFVSMSSEPVLCKVTVHADHIPSLRIAHSDSDPLTRLGTIAPANSDAEFTSEMAIKDNNHTNSSSVIEVVPQSPPSNNFHLRSHSIDLAPSDYSNGKHWHFQTRSLQSTIFTSILTIDHL